MIIQQAIYGEISGKTSGHDLLGSSQMNNELFRRVSGITDPADRPEGGVLTNPVIRGFFTESHFLLIKTFPDKSPGLRSGRVFAHALFVSKADLYRLRNISDLFQYFLPSIQKEAEMRPLEYSHQEVITKTEIVSERALSATNALLEGKPFVWLGEEGYWEWVAQIWPQLPVGAKHTLKIGAAFNPSYAKSEYLNLLYIPNDTKTLWERYSFRVIDSKENSPLPSLATHWLTGNKKESAPLQVLVDDFALKIESMEHIKMLQDYSKIYSQIDSHLELNHLLVLANFVSLTSPNEKFGIKGKNRLTAAILQAIPNAPVNMFTALIYQNWKGFPNILNPISDVVCDWLSNHLLKGKYSIQGGSVLLKAMNTQTNNWWTKIVLEYVTNRLKDRLPDEAEIIWQWMIHESTLIAKHAAWMPDNIENDLTKKKPKLDKAIAEAVLQMAKQKRWLVLHAKVVTECFPAKRAIELQLEIDKVEHHTVALEILSECIKGSEFILVAVNHTDPRLHRIAGKLITGNSQLLSGIDISSEGWQICWESAIRQGCKVWSGISNPKQTLFDILDLLLVGKTFSNTLLQVISSDDSSSLKDYSSRADIWTKLPLKARSGFITATLTDLIAEFAIDKLKYNDLEDELKKELQSEKTQQILIESKTISLAKKLYLFDVLPGLGEYHARQLIQIEQFSPDEADYLGRLIYKKKWHTLVEMLYDVHFQRRDLVPALIQCTDLLGFWKKVKLFISGLKRDAISEDEWWDAFLEISFKLFPHGPEQHGLWIRSGGDLSQIYTNCTGRDKWSQAVQIIRYRGIPTVGNLIKKMIEEYPNNEQLKNLYLTL